MSEFAEQLRQLRHGPEPALPDEVFVSRVMAVCAAQGSSNARNRRRAVYLGAGVAAAAVIALAVGLQPDPAGRGNTPAGSVAARGSGALGLSATVQAFVGRAAPGTAPVLLEGAVIGPGDGILVRYSNPAPRDVHLMVFALDARREVHWLHPAYLDEGSNPVSLVLQQQVTARTLDEVAEPENPAPGQLRVYALLSETSLDVKGVEARLAASQAPVHELFATAEVEEWRCTWRER
jgi:hypothetical protein